MNENFYKYSEAIFVVTGVSGHISTVETYDSMLQENGVTEPLNTRGHFGIAAKKGVIHEGVRGAIHQTLQYTDWSDVL